MCTQNEFYSQIITNYVPIFQNPMAQIEEEKREHHNKMLKMEREMEEVIS